MSQDFSSSRREFLERAAVGAAAIAASSPISFAQTDSSNNADKRAMTVRGPIAPGKLGTTLMHEHIYSNFTGYYELTLPMYDKVDKEKYFATSPEAKIQMEDLAYLNMGGFIFSKDGWNLAEKRLMEREITSFAKSGGHSILEVTPWGKGQDDDFHTTLRELSEKTGVNIICSTGLYGGDDHFWYDKALAMSESRLTETFMVHVEKGFADSGVRAGSLKTAPNVWTENEQRAARAVIAVQQKTGLPYTIHHGANMGQKEAEEMQQGIVKFGTNPERTILAHVQKFLVNYSLKSVVKNPEGRITVDLDFYKRMLDQGFILSFDTFSTNMGLELFEFLLEDNGDVPNAFEGASGDNDVEMLAMIYFLIQNGYSKQVVLSQDCYSKVHLRSYGGHGYTRVTNFALPLLKNVGVSDEALHDMVVGNPARLLAV